MKLTFHSHRSGLRMVENFDELTPTWDELVGVLRGVTANDVVKDFDRMGPYKSISRSLNRIIDRRLVKLRWKRQVRIFFDKEFNDKKYILDFNKDGLPTEVAFNHGGNIPSIIMKPALAVEDSRMRKAVDGQVGIVISATEDMRLSGGFDSSIGAHEDYVKTAQGPYYAKITAPLVLIGIEPFEEFRIEHEKVGDKYFGHVVANPGWVLESGLLVPEIQPQLVLV